MADSVLFFCWCGWLEENKKLDGSIRVYPNIMALAAVKFNEDGKWHILYLRSGKPTSMDQSEAISGGRQEESK